MTIQLNSKEQLAGVPVLKIRDTLKHSGGSFRADWLLDKGLPVDLCNELLRKGYIQKDNDPQHKDDSGFDWFDLTELGRQFVRSSAASRIKRSSATKTIGALQKRIEEINTSNEYMVRVDEAVIFGSYVNGSGTVGDIDFAFRTQRKIEIFGENRDWNLAASRDFRACGRTQKTILDKLFWPDMKVRLRLKNRQRTISLHDMDEFLAIQRKERTLFIVLVGNEKQILADIQNRKLSYSV